MITATTPPAKQVFPDFPDPALKREICLDKYRARRDYPNNPSAATCGQFRRSWLRTAANAHRSPDADNVRTVGESTRTTTPNGPRSNAEGPKARPAISGRVRGTSARSVSSDSSLPSSIVSPPAPSPAHSGDGFSSFQRIENTTEKDFQCQDSP
tara:strand:- start:406 stop:867 length:462 start_codon:yes stop_codon:yes gene_type:complete